ncbi:MAG: flagellar export chaperone FlgN, partial [Bdellovibrionota bacterium]
MEKPIIEIHQVLQRLLGLHRQLLDTVRLEREALTQADLKGIQEASVAKQALVEAIRQSDTERMGLVGELALAWKTPVRDLTLP